MCVGVGVCVGGGTHGRSPLSYFGYLLLARLVLISRFNGRYSPSVYRCARAFTTDADVLALCREILTVVSPFCLLDSTACLLQGVIRGVGDQSVGAWGNFVAYYVVALPLGAVL